jgi:hypothetical protein
MEIMLIHFAITLLEILFAVGIIGSALVVILTSIEDTIEIVTPEEPPSTMQPHASAAD